MDEGTGGGREDASIGGLAGLLEPAMTRFGMNVGRSRDTLSSSGRSMAQRTRDNIKAPRAINLRSARIIKGMDDETTQKKEGWIRFHSISPEKFQFQLDCSAIHQS